MKTIITKEFTTYGGDNNRDLYLDRGVTGNVQLCLTDGGGSAIAIHLTSTDPEYQVWLYKHVVSLLSISEDKWYDNREMYPRGARYHHEFHYILDKLKKRVSDLDR